ncbi:cell division protein ZapE [Ketogulonicigenium vulgare]|uniref:ATPase, AFG1 family protein n=1 Tax=Ketogulonicigenium vulgare (strain WSH-001) TaxID=759362 RepID=F9Y7R4_KETVW|nr:cell division protein ZapE [Ketogulonicigenium vulgare]ADO41643.1 ATPase, AFG1 family [Ketogulonicigenium vulgare Y25]AEM39880.1 ATPase, AFG1 family protein [Ketogulonicigenium vulgare WSH-001]ALJ80098.1 ATPase [Ketogulonicigenium vulgare]ANW32969.1 ATPase [Ketogulonicigenium vulgare]AOZ53574.1 ATPase, AFG1 family [Ketogulonicigenium vulgare]
MSVLADYEARVAAGTITPDAAQRAVLPALERLRAEISSPVKRGLFRKAVPVRGLYLWGGVGRGKSMLMDLLCQSLQVPLHRVHFHAFMQSVHAGLAKARADGVQDAILPVADDLANRIKLLALDEMQITDITDAMIVGRLFQRLFDRGVVVVTTSNRAPDDLYKNGLNRQIFLPFIAMIRDRLDVVELASPTDHRQGRLQGAQRYFAPPDMAALDAIWDDLTGRAAARPQTLRVYGRDVTLPAFHDGIARARFDDLCGKPLGPADYLAIAESCRVLILDDIPRLGPANHDKAKRFVTLIDALYEAKVRLFCSAATLPEALYDAGEGSFEFARTASRLREMQDAGWGAALA